MPAARGAAYAAAFLWSWPSGSRPGTPHTIPDVQVEQVVIRALDSTRIACHLLHYAPDGQQPDGGEPHLERLWRASASQRNLQAVERLATSRKGARHRKALSKSDGPGAGFCTKTVENSVF